MKKIIPCLDIKNGIVVKGVKFEGLRNVAPPVDLAKLYNDDGADELVFYDIIASIEGRGIYESLLCEVLKRINIPLIVGGGIKSIEDIERLLSLGASKFSINTGAIKDPGLISKAAEKFGSERIILSVDVKKVNDNYHIFTKGGMEDTGLEAIEFIKKTVDLGAGEIVVNSIDTDGVKSGYDIPLLDVVCNTVNIPIIASGGAGTIEDFIELFTKLPDIAAGLAASAFHFGDVKIPELKKELRSRGIDVKV